MIGYFTAGGSITQNVALPTDYSMQTHLLTGFEGLNEVVFAPLVNANQGGNNYEFNIDNLIVNTTPVPEPETYAMLLAGLGLLGFMARRRKQKAA